MLASGTRSLHFGFLFGFTLRALGLRETVESVISVVNLRGLIPPRQNLFAALGCGCVTMMIVPLDDF